MKGLNQEQHIQLMQFMSLMQNSRTETEMRELQEQYYNIPRYAFLRDYISEKNEGQSFSSYKTNLIYDMDKYRQDYKFVYGENFPAYRKESMPKSKADYTVMDLLNEISGCDDIETYQKLLQEKNKFPKAKIESLSPDFTGIYFADGPDIGAEEVLAGLPGIMIPNTPEGGLSAHKQLVEAGFSPFELPSAEDVRKNGIDWLHDEISHFKETLNPGHMGMENQMSQDEYEEEFDHFIEQMQANGGRSETAMLADYEAESNPRPDWFDGQGTPHWFDEEPDDEEVFDVVNLNGENYLVNDIEALLREDISAIFKELDSGETKQNLTLNGVKVYGDPEKDGKIKLLVEFESKNPENKWREDSLFDALAEAKVSFNGIEVDVNPITPEKSGTIERYLERLTELGVTNEGEAIGVLDDKLRDYKDRHKVEDAQHQMGTDNDPVDENKTKNTGMPGDRKMTKEDTIKAIDIWTEIRDLISDDPDYKAKKFGVFDYLYNKGSDDAAGYENSFERNIVVLKELGTADKRIQQILERYKDCKIDFDDQALATKIAGTTKNDFNRAKYDFEDFVEGKKYLKTFQFADDEIEQEKSLNNMTDMGEISENTDPEQSAGDTDISQERDVPESLSPETPQREPEQDGSLNQDGTSEGHLIPESLSHGSNYSDSRPRSLQELHKFFMENPYVPGTPVPTIGMRNERSGHTTLIEGYEFARLEDIGNSNPSLVDEKGNKKIDGQTVVLTKPGFREVNEGTGKRELVPDESKRHFIRISRDLYEQAIKNSQIIAKRQPKNEREKQKMYDDYLEAAHLDEKRQRANTANNFWHNYQAGVLTLANNKQEAMAFAKRLVNEMIPAEKEKFANMVRKYEKIKGADGKNLSYDQRILEQYEDITKGLRITNNSIWRDHVGKEYDTLDAIKRNTEVIDKEGQPLDKSCLMRIGDTIKMSVTVDSALSNKQIKLPLQEFRLVAHSKDNNSVALISADGKQKIIKNREDFIKKVQKIEKRQIRKQQRQDRYESISM